MRVFIVDLEILSLDVERVIGRYEDLGMIGVFSLIDVFKLVFDGKILKILGVGGCFVIY